MTDRREFLGTIALGGVALAVGWCTTTAAQAPAPTPPPVVALGLAQGQGCAYVYAGG